MTHERIIVVDFGGQYNQLVARRVRECSVYCEIYSYRTPLSQILEKKPSGIIFTGGPNSVYEEGAASCGREWFETGIPILGLCYGAQLMAQVLGGKVERAADREYGRTVTYYDSASPLFRGIPAGAYHTSPQNGIDSAGAGHTSLQNGGEPAGAGHTSLQNGGEPASFITWMSHFDYISKLPEGFRSVAHTSSTPVAAAEDETRSLYAIQFHPEVLHTQYGSDILRNFVIDICGCHGDWVMESFVREQVASIREKVGDGKVLCALSGGVDSSVAAVLLSKAVAKNLTCVFVDHGLLRKDEGDEVEKVFGDDGPYELNFIRVNAQERFYDKLSGVTGPEKKRKIIGEEFIRVFEEQANAIGEVDFLVQGTIYPDVVESGLGGESAVIKSHHNVGGLPDHVNFKEIIEPLRNLFKDEVRKVGLELGIPEHLVFRQPFPGPGLGIRIIGEVTAEKVRIVQEADAIYREEVAKAADLYRTGKTGPEGSEPTLDGSPACTDSDNDTAQPYPEIGGTPTSAGGSAAGDRFSLAIMPPWMPDQYFAALTNMRSVGVMGDERTYDYAVVLRAVRTIDFMTAESAPIPWDVLQTVTSRIINEVRGINRVLYDLTGKPPATIEME